MTTTSTNRWVQYWVREYNQAALRGDYVRCAHARTMRIHHEWKAMGM